MQTKERTFNYTPNKQLAYETIKDSNGDIVKTTYKYPFDFKNSEPYQSMVDKNILSPVIERAEYKNEQLLQKEITEYKVWENNQFLPEFVKFQTKSQAAPETRIIYNKYDNYGNPIFITKDGNENNVYFWGWKGLHMTAEIKNATYSEVTANMNVATKNLIMESDITWRDGANTLLRGQLSNAQITQYIFQPLIGIETIIDPRNVTTHYEYDAFGRLKRTYLIENGVEKTVQEYDYHYKNQ